MPLHPPYRLLLSGLGLALALGFACTDDVGSGPTPAESGLAAAPPEQRCAALSSLPRADGDLKSRLLASRIEPRGSNRFREPSPQELRDFESAFGRLLNNGPSLEVVGAFASLGFEVVHFVDRKAGGNWLLIEDADGGRGTGTFVVNPAPARDLWLEAPHADSDEGTLRQTAEQLVSLGARALLITGSNRCANAERTPCSGKSNMCGGALRVSDAAHFDRNFFTAAHRALRKAYPRTLAASVHGMDSAGKEAAVISNGTRAPSPGSFSTQLRDALNARLGPGERAYSCNDPADDGLFRPLCGVTNVQGRIDNAAPNACSASADSASGDFVHIEQGPDLRAEGIGPDALSEALAEVMPCSMAGNGLDCPTVLACR